MTEDNGVYGEPLAIGTKVRWTHSVSGLTSEGVIDSYWVESEDVPNAVLSVPYPYRIWPPNGDNHLAAPDELKVLND